MAKPITNTPLKAVMGWLEAESPKDARAYARGVVQQTFRAHEESWYAVIPYYGGFLWEAHEGGNGKGYIKAVAKALDENPGGEFWFPSDDRVVQIVMQDAKPFPCLLPEHRSIEVMNGPTPPLEPGYAMTPYVRKGTGWLITGSCLSGIGAVFFLGSVAFYAVAYNPGPSVRAVDLATLPHMHWSQVTGTTVEEIVSKLQLTGDQWNVIKRPHKIEGLDELRQKEADIQAANKAAQQTLDAQQKADKDKADAQDQVDLQKMIEDAKHPGATPAVEPTVVTPSQAPAAQGAQTAPITPTSQVTPVTPQPLAPQPPRPLVIPPGQTSSQPPGGATVITPSPTVIQPQPGPATHPVVIMPQSGSSADTPPKPPFVVKPEVRK